MPTQTTDRVMNMSLDEFTRLYLSWRNEFVTMEAFAREYGLSYAVATEIITLGRAIGNIRAAVASAVQAKDCIAFVANKAGENVLRVRWNATTKEVDVASGEHGDVTDVVKEAFAIVNNKNINKHMAVCLDNEISCPVRMICVN